MAERKYVLRFLCACSSTRCDRLRVPCRCRLILYQNPRLSGGISVANGGPIWRMIFTAEKSEARFAGRGKRLSKKDPPDNSTKTRHATLNRGGSLTNHNKINADGLQRGSTNVPPQASHLENLVTSATLTVFLSGGRILQTTSSRTSYRASQST